MKIRHLWKTIIAVLCTMVIVFSSCLGVKAQEFYSYEVNFIPTPYGDLMAVDGSGDYIPDYAYLKGVCIVDSVFKELGTLSDFNPEVVRDSYGCYGLAFPRSEVERMFAIHNQCQAWCAANVPLIVPDGTSLTDAIFILADWVAGVMTYDHAALSDSALLTYYQNALPGFQTGKGVCATYATMFNTVVHWLPVDIATQTVSYGGTNVFHCDTKYISNEEHGWSAIKADNNQWVLFDITFYDNNDGPRQPQYLMMPLSAIMDGAHSDIVSMFYIEHGNTIMANGY